MTCAVVDQRRHVAPAAVAARSGQRVWKRQPGGGLIGLGMSPSSSARSRTARRIGQRHRRQQRPRVGVARVAEQLVGRRGLDDLAEIHHGDAVGDVLHDREIVA